MRFLLTSLLLLVGLNQILGRSLWNPYSHYYDQDRFGMPVNHFFDDFDGLRISESSEEKQNNEHQTLENFFNSFASFHNEDLDLPESREMADSEEKASEPEERVKEEDNQEENENAVAEWILIKNVDKSEEVEPVVDTKAEEDVLTKSSEEEEDITVTQKDIEEMTKFLVVLSAIDELLKISLDDADKSVDEDESREKDLKEFDDFLKTIIDSIGEDNDDEDNMITTTTKKDSSEEVVDVTTTPKPDSSEEVDVTTPKPDSSEEEDVTTPKPDSSEEEDITPKPDSDEDENNDDNTNDNQEYEPFVLHIIDSNEHSEQLDDHKYEIINTFKPTRSPNVLEFIPTTSNADDQNIIQQYVEIRENLDNEENKFKVNKINLDKDFYNIISSSYNDEGVQKFENDVYVLHENFDRIKRHINGMENLNSKLYFQNLIKTAVKNVQNKSKDLITKS